MVITELIKEQLNRGVAPKLALDHIVLAVPDLKQAMNYFQEKLGVTAMIGGKHVGLGTHNALLGIGDPNKHMYLELIAIDPDDPKEYSHYFFGIKKNMPAAYVATWCLRCETANDMEITNQSMNKMGAKYQHGAVRKMQRQTPAGAILSWQIANAVEQVQASCGQVPFLICWDDFRLHPTTKLAAENWLDFSLEFAAPDYPSLANNLDSLGFEKPAEVRFSAGEKPAINLTLKNSHSGLTFTS